MNRGWIAAPLLLLALAACGGDLDGGGDAESASAHDAATAVQDKIEAIEKIEDLTEDTDSNDLLGRPDGYKAATVLHDSRADGCLDNPGVDCGAVIEEWPSSDAAQERADYIEAIGAPLANEYDTVKGSLILRVSGALKPAEADEYEAAFGD